MTTGYLGIVVEHLVPEELNHELEIRDLAVPQDVESRQKRLKRALKEEAINGITMISSSVVASLVPLTEWKSCRIRLNEIQYALAGENRYSPLRRVMLSRARVLAMRMQRYSNIERETASLFEGLVGENRALIQNLEAEIRGENSGLGGEEVYLPSIQRNQRVSFSEEACGQTYSLPDSPEQVRSESLFESLAFPSPQEARTSTPSVSLLGPELGETGSQFPLSGQMRVSQLRNAQESGTTEEWMLPTEANEALRSGNRGRQESRAHNSMSQRPTRAVTVGPERRERPNQNKDSPLEALASMSVEDLRRLHETFKNLFLPAEPVLKPRSRFTASRQTTTEISNTHGSEHMTSSRLSGGYEERIPYGGGETGPAERFRNPRLGLPVSKWKIEKFSGKEDELPRFLSTVRQFAMAEGTSEDELFRSRIHLFTGDAADFVATASDVNSWSELVRELTRYCLGSCSDSDVIRKIERRVQKDESCAVYLTRMDLMFGILANQLSEEEKVDIAIRGMRFSVRQALAGSIGLNRLSDLKIAAQRAERLLTPSASEGIRRSSQEQMIRVSNSAVEHRSNERREPRMGGSLGPKCFKCVQTGHLQNTCNNQLWMLWMWRKGNHKSKLS